MTPESGGVPHPEKSLASRSGGYGVTGCDPAIAAPQRKFESPLHQVPLRDKWDVSDSMLPGSEVSVGLLPHSGEKRPEERCIVLPLQRGRPRFFLQHRFKPRN
jgi:hypothetical protein